MNFNPFALLSILSSTFLAFVTMAFALEVIFKIFTIGHARIKAILRLLPFVALFIDLVFNQISLAHWINPLSCSSCVQKLLLTVFFPELKSYLSFHEISLVSYLNLQFQHSILIIPSAVIILISLFFVLQKFVESYHLIRSLKSIIKNSTICPRIIENPLLAAVIMQNTVKIYVSEEIPSPLATINHTILLPKASLDNWTQKEFEAVIAHEWEHIKYHDPLFKLFYQLTAALFWWIPTRFWEDKTELDQEVACDQNIGKYGIEKESIACAITKTIKTHIEFSRALCYLITEKHPTMIRLKAILDPRCAADSKFIWHHLLGISLAGIFLLVCVSWQ